MPRLTPPPLLLDRRVLVADGAMGTMLQELDLTAADFGGYEGCNEMLNLTRPEAVADVHRAYLAAGSDLVETNTFGANLTALREYGLADRLEELAEAGARIARQAADEWTTPSRPRWVLGSVGPGTKLPSLGQVSYAEIRDACAAQVAAMIRGGIDAVQIETGQDLLAVRAGVAGARRAMRQAGVDLPLLVSITLETTGAMLVGSDLSAVVASLVPLGVDALGLNCATGPDRMKGPLRRLAASCPLPLTCMPNAGLPRLTPAGAVYPLEPDDFASAMTAFVRDQGLALVGGCCGTTPAHIKALVDRLAADGLGGPGAASPDQTADQRPETSRLAGAAPDEEGDDASGALVPPAWGPGWVSSLYSATPLTQEVSYLAVGERTNAAGSKAFREAMLAGDWEACVEIARREAQASHVLDLCVDYVGRDGRTDMAELAGRIAREVDIPLQLDSSDPEVIRTGLELAPGRSIVNSVNLEQGAGPGSKFATTMGYVREHGAVVVGLCIDERGQARSVEEKVAVARRLIETMQQDYGLDPCDIIIDCLTFPITTGQAENRRDGANTIEAIARLKADFPRVHTVLGVSNVSFGLKPAARTVLNSVFLDQCRQAGLDCAIVNPSRIWPLASLPADQVAAAQDLIWDRGDHPLDRYLALFEGAPAETAAEDEEDLPVTERLRRRILDGRSAGLAEELEEALAVKPALALINEDLLAAMREVGERFGAGRMQLPFVLKSAEVMKRAVTFLEPHLDRLDQAGRGTIVLATVQGDVHDIGKNLVDIILTNNGYRVVNLGIKQPIADIISAAEEVGADAIGLSGLLVRSTQVMREDLEELNDRGLAATYPVLLGGAALTRSYVEQDLSAVYQGEVRYARDAFEGLALMDAVVARRDGLGDLPALRPPRPVSTAPAPSGGAVRSGVTRPVPGGVEVPRPPFWGVRQADATLEEVLPWLDQRALFAGQWGLKAGSDGPDYQELVAREGRPRLESWIERIQEEGLADFRVVWGYWPCHSAGDDLVVTAPDGSGELVRFHFPRQPGGERLCLADYFRDQAEADLYGPDLVACQLVTAGARFSRAAAGLFAADDYRDYFELHGLSVQLAEALAERWHERVRGELGLAELTDDKAAKYSRQLYQGERFSFGYPACPDLSQRRQLVGLLRPEAIGVTLSEEDQLQPEQSTDALILHHPQAHYFSVR